MEGMVNNKEKDGLSRRRFLKVGAATALSTLATGPFCLRWGLTSARAEGVTPFTFAYISDAHLYAEFGPGHRFIKAMEKAVADVNALSPQPDFVLFGGDLAQLGREEELQLGKKLLDGLKAKVYMMVGEHDWYLDMGKKWRELFGKDTYSFDHKGVHFVVLNSVVEEDFWTAKGMTPMERMKTVAGLDNPVQTRFTVGKDQREWLRDDLSRISENTPIIVFSHSPLYKYYRSWNFWTDDAEEVQTLLFPFEAVTVIHGHTHQVLTNRIKNISFHGVLSTAWPWPYPPSGLPRLTFQMDRADPFNQFDACGWGTVEVLGSGQVNKLYKLWDREPMKVSYERLASGEVPAYPASWSAPSY